MKKSPKTSPPRQPIASPASVRPLILPLMLSLGLAAFGFVPRIRSLPLLLGSMVGASAVLLIWWLLLILKARGRALRVEILLRPEHYMQMVAQLAIYVYWGFYWQPIQDAAALIAAQVVFAYAFDMLLSWSRRDTYTLSFVQFPVVFSINLFLRFHDDFFYLQFVLVGFAFLAKEFIRWNKDGRRVHIFNPSSFPLAVASVILLLTHTTDLTWGVDIATQLFRPPQIYLFLFLISLPGQFKFGITTMSLSAILTTYGFGLAYFAVTGTYFFIDNYIPVAVFLGMLLLFVDPATAPRTELGRVIFGVLYGASTVGLYALLDKLGAPTFYDKLLQIPVLNLSVQMIDRLARSPRLAWLDPARWGRSLRPIRRNLAYTSIWVVAFGAMSFAQGVGDHHPGHRVPFWEKACDQNLRNGCQQLANIESILCARGSGWACNEHGLLMFTRRAGSTERAAGSFQRACVQGFGVGCTNAAIVARGVEGRPQSAPPQAADYAVVLREGKGELPDRTPFELFTRACDQGWMAGCAKVAEAYLKGQGTARNPDLAAREFNKACDGGDSMACSNVGFMYKSGDGVARDDVKAIGYLKRACSLGMAQACRWLEEERPSTQ